ncbi:hypothetical protein AYO38_02265 [bacterium SCGC AG-212-C10]|nr:hypothetical protein AYO38_02265 [bacterium SCGC AG-212-C10]
MHSLYLDEDVDIAIAHYVRARGYNVTTAVEAGIANRREADGVGAGLRDGECDGAVYDEPSTLRSTPSSATA